MDLPRRGFLLWFTLVASWNACGTAAFDYAIDDGGSIVLTDSATKISELRTFFRNELTQVSLKDVTWTANDDSAATNNNSTTTLIWETLVDDTVVDSGEVSLEDVGRELPTEFEAGEVQVSSDVTITVRLTLDGSTTEVASSYQTYRPGVSLIPLLLVLVLSMTTHMVRSVVVAYCFVPDTSCHFHISLRVQVEVSLFATIFVGACIITGSLVDGFKTSLDTYILGALADTDHGYVYLFTLFLAGLVGMMEKSGGMIGFTRDISTFAKTSRTGQLCAFAVGYVIKWYPVVHDLCYSPSTLAHRNVVPMA